MLEIKEMPESLRKELVKRGCSEEEIRDTIHKLNNLSWEEFYELAKETAKYLEDCFAKEVKLKKAE